MGKNDKKDLYNTSMDKVKESENDYNNLNNQITGRSDTTWDRATDDYNGAKAGYDNYAQGGGLTQADIDRMNAAYGAIGGAGGGGGVSNPLSGKSSHYAGLSSAYSNAYRPDYSEADAGFRKLSGSTGGFDSDKLNQIYGNIDTLSGIGQTGGITDEDKSSINRQSILDQEQNGGYTDADRAYIRAKSSASAPAYFSALKDNLQRNRSITGNLAGAGATDFKLARQQSQQQAQDRMNTEIGLSDSIRTGRQQAGDFLSNQGLALAGLRTGNQIQGATNAASQGTGLQTAITGNQLQGLTGLQTSQTGLGNWGLGQAAGLDQFGLSQAGGLDQWDESNASRDMQAGAANAGAAREAAAQNAAYQQWLTTYGNSQKQYGIDGLDDLYKTNLGASQNYSGLSLDALNGKYGQQGNLLGLATQNRGNTAMDNAGMIGNMIGSAAGIATGMGGGKSAPQGYAPGLSPRGGAAPNGSDYFKFVTQ